MSNRTNSSLLYMSFKLKNIGNCCLKVGDPEPDKFLNFLLIKIVFFYSLRRQLTRLFLDTLFGCISLFLNVFFSRLKREGNKLKCDWFTPYIEDQFYTIQ